MKYRTDIAALLARYAVPAGECLEWRGYKNRLGYGRACVTLADGSHKLLCVHRLAYELHAGPIPDGAAILHTCDNRGCIQPKHLRAGTQAENLADMTAKGRAHWQRLAREREAATALWRAQSGFLAVREATAPVAVPVLRPPPPSPEKATIGLQLPGHVWKRPLTP